jgi:DNA-binding transcriptional MocR family regulator
MTSSKYIQIAQKLMADIESEHILVNTRLPSLRAIMAMHSISMTTAIACYRHMEKSGYAVAEEKKGFYSQRPYPSSNKTEFPQFSGAIIKQPARTQDYGIDISMDSLAIAKLDTRLIDHSFIKQSIHAAVKKSSFNLNNAPAQGSEPLRAQLANHFNQQGFSSHPDELVVTNGCLDAIVLALEVVSKPGDVIAVSSPCYSGLLDILSLLERSILEIPSTADGIDLLQLTKLAKSNQIAACILTANHQNPTGHSLSSEQKMQLAELAATFELPIIEDDVFRELAHHKTIPLPIKYYDYGGWVLWCSSFSKILAPGLRLGWCKPGRFFDKYLRLRKVKTLGINQPIQTALADYIEKGHYLRHIKKMNQVLCTHSRTYIDVLQQGLPKNSQIYLPTGGLVLWICVPTLDTKQLASMLAKQGIYIQEGNAFSTTHLYQDCFRINFGLVPDNRTLAQLTAITHTVNALLVSD